MLGSTDMLSPYILNASPLRPIPIQKNAYYNSRELKVERRGAAITE
jgi:hypothetical protein